LFYNSNELMDYVNYVNATLSETLLHKAARDGNLLLCVFLYLNGANLDYSNKDGTALSIAVKLKKSDVELWLKKKGALAAVEIQEEVVIIIPPNSNSSAHSSTSEYFNKFKRIY